MATWITINSFSWFTSRERDRGRESRAQRRYGDGASLSIAGDTVEESRTRRTGHTHAPPWLASSISTESRRASDMCWLAHLRPDDRTDCFEPPLAGGNCPLRAALMPRQPDPTCVRAFSVHLCGFLAFYSSPVIRTQLREQLQQSGILLSIWYRNNGTHFFSLSFFNWRLAISQFRSCDSRIEAEGGGSKHSHNDDRFHIHSLTHDPNACNDWINHWYWEWRRARVEWMVPSVTVAVETKIVGKL